MGNSCKHSPDCRHADQVAFRSVGLGLLLVIIPCPPCAFLISLVGISLVSSGSNLSSPWLLTVALSLNELNCTLLYDVKKDFLKNTGVDSSS